MTRARELADQHKTLDVDGGTIKLDGNYPVGTGNVALGDSALDDGSLSGNYNVAIGNFGLSGNTTGSGNIAIGSSTLGNNQTGSSNTAIGSYDGTTLPALYYNTSGSNNTATGVGALANTTSSNNTAVGYAALYDNTTGANNVAVGNLALENNTTGQRNTALGYSAGSAITTTSYSVFIGSYCGDSATGSSNVAIGDTSMRAATGSGNVAVGSDSLNQITSGSYNTCLGFSAGTLLTAGSKNTILGRYNGNQDGLDIRTLSNRIVLSDGDGNVRLYINNGGELLIQDTGSFTNTPVQGNTAGGFSYRPAAQLEVQGNATQAAFFGRTNDGQVVGIYSAGTREGDISVSGTTVSYNGGHLSRWSQLANNTRDTSIVKGTVMTNLDQMAEWTNDGVTEDNEQLNCMAVSSVEGDSNVAGVFVNWDDDDDTYHNDMNVAMTGDMVIRIASGTTVARGDLLMSAGDGTAKPQGDDIVRSKTIAKVTSTNVSHTYDDGSYLVPCVLMAC